eukprot:c23752_g1_i3 orf=536-1261(+)
MASPLDMSLDDLIKNNKQAGRGRGRGRGAASRRGAATTGPIRRVTTRSSARPTPYSSAKPVQTASDGPWQHDLFEDGAGAAPVRPLGIETGTKLYISNLDYGVSNEDIKELFSEVGDLKRCGVHYDRSGRSKGTAEVVYSRRADAIAAMKRYNNVQLDGKPMKIELVGTNLSVSAPVLQTANGVATAGRGGRALWTVARGRGASRRGRGRGRGRGRDASNVSIEDLDAELDSYHAEAMQIC